MLRPGQFIAISLCTLHPSTTVIVVQRGPAGLRARSLALAKKGAPFVLSDTPAGQGIGRYKCKDE